VRSPHHRSDWYDAMCLDTKKDNMLSQRNDELHSKFRAKLATGVGPPFRRGRNITDNAVVCGNRK
jgi:hypothetical protein